MSQYRCYFILFQPALLFPFLVGLGFALVFVCLFLFLSLFMHCVFSFLWMCTIKKPPIMWSCGFLSIWDFLEIDKTPSKISNMLQGLVANYRIQLTRRQKQIVVFWGVLHGLAKFTSISLLAFVWQAKLCYVHVSLSLAESPRSFSPTDWVKRRRPEVPISWGFQSLYSGLWTITGLLETFSF